MLGTIVPICCGRGRAVVMALIGGAAPYEDFKPTGQDYSSRAQGGGSQCHDKRARVRGVAARTRPGGRVEVVILKHNRKYGHRRPQSQGTLDGGDHQHGKTS